MVIPVEMLEQKRTTDLSVRTTGRLVYELKVLLKPKGTPRTLEEGIDINITSFLSLSLSLFFFFDYFLCCCEELMGRISLSH